MRPRQTTPVAWMIIADEAGLGMVARLPRGAGLLLLSPVSLGVRKRARRLAVARGLALVEESQRIARRVHNSRELRDALLQRAPLILISPLYPTSTHPEWRPLPRMPAAALVRLGGRRLLALGGMNPKRYAGVAALGFRGWAGISAFRT